jgi:hypothetical protein
MCLAASEGSGDGEMSTSFGFFPFISVSGLFVSQVAGWMNTPFLALGMLETSHYHKLVEVACFVLINLEASIGGSLWVCVQEPLNGSRALVGVGV